MIQAGASVGSRSDKIVVSFVEWGAVLAGAVLAAALSFVLLTASVDIHIYIGAATLPITSSVSTRSRLPTFIDLTLRPATRLAATSARPSILTLCAAGSFLLALLLHLLYESLRAGSGGARKECRRLLSAYANGQHRCGGA